MIQHAGSARHRSFSSFSPNERTWCDQVKWWVFWGLGGDVGFLPLLSIGLIVLTGEESIAIATSRTILAPLSIEMNSVITALRRQNQFSHSSSLFCGSSSEAVKFFSFLFRRTAHGDETNHQHANPWNRRHCRRWLLIRREDQLLECLLSWWLTILLREYLIFRRWWTPYGRQVRRSVAVLRGRWVRNYAIVFLLNCELSAKYSDSSKLCPVIAVAKQRQAFITLVVSN